MAQGRKLGPMAGCPKKTGYNSDCALRSSQEHGECQLRSCRPCLTLPVMLAEFSLSVSCRLTNGDNTQPMTFLEANEARSGKHFMLHHTRAEHDCFQTGYFKPEVGKLTANDQRIKFLLLLQKFI